MPPTKGKKKRGVGRRKKISANRSSSAGSSTTPTATTTSTASIKKRKEAPANCAKPKEGKKRVNHSRNSSTQKFIKFFTQLEQLPPDKLYKTVSVIKIKLEEATKYYYPPP